MRAGTFKRSGTELIPARVHPSSPARQNAESVRGLRDEFEGVQRKLDQLVEDLPVLDARCRTFLEAIERIAAARTANRSATAQPPNRGRTCRSPSRQREAVS